VTGRWEILCRGMREHTGGGTSSVVMVAGDLRRKGGLLA